MLAVWQSHAGSWCAAREVCYSAAMNLREKALAGLQLQHPTRHLSVHKLCSQACGKEGEAREGSSWLQLLRPGVAGHAEQKLFPAGEDDDNPQ